MRLCDIVSTLALSTIALGGCSSPGAECCDCLIDEGCWGADDYACYYYYDEDYSGDEESPPPAQTWSSACQDDKCPDCDEADSNFQ